MQSMSDNELDNLFKVAAEGFTPPQDQHAWKQMASLLDQHAVKAPGFWNGKTISLLTAVGLIAITATWYGVSSEDKLISKTGEKNGANNATQGVVQEQKEQSPATGEKNLTASQSVESKGSRVRAIDKNETTALQTNSQNRNVSPTNKKDNENAGNAETTHEPEISSNKILIAEEKVEEETVQRSQISKGSEAVIATDSVKSEPEEIKTDSVAELTDKPSPKEEKVKTGSGISLKAVISPDFSSVNFFSASKPGINYGLLAGYSFNNRWSVYTGVIYSKKLYTSTEIEEAYSSNGHDYPVKELEGDCRILDIPINVYYTFFPERTFSLRAGLGFSSYIMRKEDYVYCVDNYGNDVYYEQQVRGKNNEWFKVMNVSLMVSKKLTSRLSAEFEPFVKAPLAGVGEGKVSLVSMGAFINVKFDLTHSK